MDKFIAREGKILVDSQGRFLIPATIPALTFQIADTQFPPTGHSGRDMKFITTSLPQTIYVDFGDESPIFEEAFTSTVWETSLFRTGTDGYARVLKTYPDTSVKNVKIWFSNPEKIKTVSVSTAGSKWNFVGDFPLNLGIYNLDTLLFRNTKFSTFPVQLSGGKFSFLTFNNATLTPINYIPKWIYSSQITTLTLTGGFNLSDLSVSNLDKLINIQGLTNLFLDDVGVNAANIPDNLKDISTLRVLSFGDAPLTEVPVQFNNCKQITELAMGYRAGGNASSNSSITAWGVGVANMPNLKIFSAINTSNISTDLVTGIETSGITSYQTNGSYLTVARIDESIIKCLAKVSSIASMTVGNTVLRNITWINTSSTTAIPTGVFEAPPNFVLGSSNGDVQTAMQAVYVLCKQYRWTVAVSIIGTPSKTYNYLS
ncbi:hypothetical protein EGI11_03340 [Chryseobacterium sp. H3056]|uniref:Leucine-rich repeat domain-containing protein n=1 Tax=Kaistella daneshvariae TaxID=2487074 RepID=A0A3N0WXX5_9FLAO|nr:hypothetical protein [Kaistella daneshvariae]ROI09805.1 hypothetical protein EGI11_03340 [Kaistella daneshvariae]